MMFNVTDKPMITNKDIKYIQNTESTAASDNRFHLFLAVLACIALPLIIYSNSLRAPFVFDDYDFIVNNRSIKLETQPVNYPDVHDYILYNKLIPSRPLTFLTLAINYRINKLDTFGYHIVNLIIHILTVILSFFLIRKILFYTVCSTGYPQNTFIKGNTIIPLLAALLFAAHPMNTEVVTYISHRSESLAACFYIASFLLCIITFEGRKKTFFYSIIFFILSFMSKETAATLPLMILIFDYIFISKGKIEELKKRKVFHIVLWGILCCAVIIRSIYIGGIGAGYTNVYAKWTSYSYFLTQSFVVLNYIKLLFVPVGQCIDHFITPARSILDGRILISYSLWISMFLTLYLIHKKGSTFAGLLSFSVAWFLITLAPTSSIIPIHDAMTERRVYISGIGFYLSVLIIYLTAFKIRLNEITSMARYRTMLCFMGIHIIVLSMATWKRNELYNDPLLLWNQAIELYPNNDRGYFNLAVRYAERKEYKKAEQLYQKAIALNPKFAVAYYNLGLLYFNENNYENAKQLFEKSIQLNPRFPNVYFDLGLLYYYDKKYEIAEQLYEKCIQLSPDFANAYCNLGAIQTNKQDNDKAIVSFLKAIELNPDHVEAHYNLGNLYYKTKNHSGALQEYIIASKLDPSLNSALRDKIEILQKSKDK